VECFTTFLPAPSALLDFLSSLRSFEKSGTTHRKLQRLIALRTYNSTRCLLQYFTACSLQLKRISRNVKLKRVRVVANKVCYLFMSVRLTACVGADPTGRISMKFSIGDSHWKYVEKIQIWLKSKKYLRFPMKNHVSFISAGNIKLPGKWSLRLKWCQTAESFRPLV
jgi:hypothetical protein